MAKSNSPHDVRPARVAPSGSQSPRRQLIVTALAPVKALSCASNTLWVDAERRAMIATD